MTKTSKENHVTLKRVPCINYPLCFQKNTVGIRTLVDSGSEVNAIILTYAAKLGLKVWKTNIRAQKIDGSTLDTFEMVLPDF